MPAIGPYAKHHDAVVPIEPHRSKGRHTGFESRQKTAGLVKFGATGTTLAHAPEPKRSIPLGDAAMTRTGAGSMCRHARRAVTAFGSRAIGSAWIGILTRGRHTWSRSRSSSGRTRDRRRCRTQHDRWSRSSRCALARRLIDVARLGTIIMPDRSASWRNGGWRCGDRALARGLVRIARLGTVVVAGCSGLSRRRCGGSCCLAHRLISVPRFGAVVISGGRLSRCWRSCRQRERQRQRRGSKNKAAHLVTPLVEAEVCRLFHRRAIGAS